MQFNYSKYLFPQETFKKPSVLFIVFTVCFAFWFVDFWKPYNAAKNETNFVWDVFGYYSYLPATFLNKGSFNWHNAASYYNAFGPLNTHMPKYTYGMSIMYAPFF